MESKVWTVLEKEKWTEEGVKYIENLYDTVGRIFEKADKKDLLVMIEGMDTNLYEVMDMMDMHLDQIINQK